jgi:hypothetical protein
VGARACEAYHPGTHRVREEDQGVDRWARDIGPARHFRAPAFARESSAAELAASGSPSIYPISAAPVTTAASIARGALTCFLFVPINRRLPSCPFTDYPIRPCGIAESESVISSSRTERTRHRSSHGSLWHGSLGRGAQVAPFRCRVILVPSPETQRQQSRPRVGCRRSA